MPGISGGAEKLFLISLILECILYGILFLLFVVSLFVAYQTSTKFGPAALQRMRVHGVGTILFTLATVHIVMNAHLIVRAFTEPVTEPVTDAASARNAIEMRLLNISGTPYILKSAVFVVQVALGDGFWLYRLHVVWRGDRRVLVPFGTVLLSAIGVGCYTLHLFAISPSPEVVADPIFQTKIRVIGIVFVALMLTTNLGCTILIAARLYVVDDRVLGRVKMAPGRTPRDGVLMRFALLVIESGAIYSMFLLILLVSFVASSRVSAIANDAISHVVAIVFYMVAFHAQWDTIGYIYSDQRVPPLPQEQPGGRELPLHRLSRLDQQDISSPPEARTGPMVIHVTRWESRTVDGRNDDGDKSKK